MSTLGEFKTDPVTDLNNEIKMRIKPAEAIKPSVEVAFSLISG